MVWAGSGFSCGSARCAWLACAVALFACASKREAPDLESEPPNAGMVGADTGTAGSGARAGESGGATPPAKPATDSGAKRCMPGRAPDDEFFVPCPDAGAPTDPGPDAGAHSEPVPDAGHAPDAGTVTMPHTDPPPPPVDAGPTTPPDQGECAARDPVCASGHAMTVLGSATCAISLDSLRVTRQVCETCGHATDIVDFGIVVMDCGGCFQVFRDSRGVSNRPLAASACTSVTDTTGLEWTTANSGCVDVYAAVGSGIEDMFGSMTLSNDEVRVCRCNRVTDTCISCIDGACDRLP